MFEQIGDHPDIARAMRTGYPFRLREDDEEDYDGYDADAEYEERRDGVFNGYDD